MTLCVSLFPAAHKEATERGDVQAMNKLGLVLKSVSANETDDDGNHGRNGTGIVGVPKDIKEAQFMFELDRTLKHRRLG